MKKNYQIQKQLQKTLKLQIKKKKNQDWNLINYQQKKNLLVIYLKKI